jgi:hypothetical protein
MPARPMIRRLASESKRLDSAGRHPQTVSGERLTVNRKYRAGQRTQSRVNGKQREDMAPPKTGRAIRGIRDAHPVYRSSLVQFLKLALSITNRYFTSPFNSLSYASLICWIGMISTSEVIPCSEQ